MWVPDMATFNKFSFAQPVPVPSIVAQYLPTGPNVG
jgi:hypothetical protein